jgi:hypothetical protein
VLTAWILFIKEYSGTRVLKGGIIITPIIMKVMMELSLFLFLARGYAANAPRNTMQKTATPVMIVVFFIALSMLPLIKAFWKFCQYILIVGSHFEDKSDLGLLAVVKTI